MPDSIGIFKCGDRPDALKADEPDYGEMLQNMMMTAGMSGRDFIIYDVISTDESRLEELFDQASQECRGYIISGSKYGAYDNIPWIGKLQDFIRREFSQQKIFIGICFGHQIMAQALGGKVEKSEKGWGYGLQTYHLKRDKYDFAGKDSLTLYGIHADQIIEKPELAAIIAASEFCTYAVLDYRGANGGRGFSTQAHPEFSAQYEQAMMMLYGGVYWTHDEAQAAIAAIAQQKSIDADLIAAHIAQIFAGQR